MATAAVGVAAPITASIAAISDAVHSVVAAVAVVVAVAGGGGGGGGAGGGGSVVVAGGGGSVVVVAAELVLPSVSTVLVVGLFFDPTARVAAQDELASLVVDEDQDRERNGRQPPGDPVRSWPASSSVQHHTFITLLSYSGPSTGRRCLSLLTTIVNYSKLTT